MAVTGNSAIAPDALRFSMADKASSRAVLVDTEVPFNQEVSVLTSLLSKVVGEFDGYASGASRINAVLPTLPAIPMSPLVNAGVLLIEGVPVLADGLCGVLGCVPDTAKNVDSAWNGFEMVGIDAAPISALVVDLHPIGNCAVGHLKREDMRTAVPLDAVIEKHAVSRGNAACGPVPALLVSSPVNSRPEQVSSLSVHLDLLLRGV